MTLLVTTHQNSTKLASFAVDVLHFEFKVSAALISFSEEEVVTLVSQVFLIHEIAGIHC
jgi:hypothetical protein